MYTAHTYIYVDKLPLYDRSTVALVAVSVRPRPNNRLPSVLSPWWHHGSEPSGKGSSMALQGRHGSPVWAFPAPLTSETRRDRAKAPARRQPTAACVSYAAGQEDPAKRGVYPSNQVKTVAVNTSCLTLDK